MNLERSKDQLMLGKRDTHSWISLIAFKIKHHKNPPLSETTEQTDL